MENPGKHLLPRVRNIRLTQHRFTALLDRDVIGSRLQPRDSKFALLVRPRPVRLIHPDYASFYILFAHHPNLESLKRSLISRAHTPTDHARGRQLQHHSRSVLPNARRRVRSFIEEAGLHRTQNGIALSQSIDYKVSALIRNRHAAVLPGNLHRCTPDRLSGNGIDHGSRHTERARIGL